ncbi:MAG: PAS domain S-box protein, partial [Deltaproteobacteria bacterium]|nr:PAS domain S-box protein [Deltaproteobacteria bacterium]
MKEKQEPSYQDLKRRLAIAERALNSARHKRGEPVGLMTDRLDITEHKEGEEEIEAYISLLDDIMEHSPFAMWISDGTGMVVKTNRALRKALNLTDDKILGKYNVLEDVNLDEQGVMPQVRAVFKEHKPARFTIPWEAAKGGDVAFEGANDLWIDVSIFPVMGQEGDLRNVVCQWIDVTRQKQSEEALQAS